MIPHDHPHLHVEKQWPFKLAIRVFADGTPMHKVTSRFDKGTAKYEAALHSTVIGCSLHDGKATEVNLQVAAYVDS